MLLQKFLANRMSLLELLLAQYHMAFLLLKNSDYPLYMFVRNLKHMDEKTKLKGVLKMIKMLLL